ncbi:hypothetical protein P691DRAFT_759887 [Macrolepiota fuliginosa MF-IS2]|uniref:Transcription elongation factor Eaf N-terminal domain-containing protein n=1 Tax=Macrolepiota fuliginosa MF-IS2 TaxID=1400762 RepID=A0A9P6C4Q4_9AGAR|nr:hypothetical protein P691DRAFT_759887 [Macrolepiota fuliginosa MF-IS2]
MASTSTSWMPTQGKFQVTIGSSLGRALKARKQGGTPPATNPKRNLPDKDFHSFKYNFKPPSIDSTKAGSIEVKKGKDKTQVAVEHLSSQVGDAYIFAGTETPSKEWDCVLIYDEETGAYTLEKLDSVMHLTWERKRTPTARVPSPVALSPTDRDAEGDDDEELEKELLGLAENIPPAKVIKPRPLPLPARPPPQKKEEEEDIEEIFIPSVPESTPQPPPPKPQPPKATRPTKPIPKPRAPAAVPTMAVEPPPQPVAVAPPAVPTPKPKAAPKLKKKREPETPVLSDSEVEVLDFGQPTKRAKVAATPPVATPTPPQPSEGFALPGSSSSGFFQPPPPPVPAPVVKPQRTAAPPPPTLPAGAEEDSEEDDWEEVANIEPLASAEPPARALSYHSDEGDVDGGLFGPDDGDVDRDLDEELALQLDEGMDDLEGDFLAAAMTEPPPQSDVQPMSLKQFAEGLADDSSEEFSSSDDSDYD